MVEPARKSTAPPGSPTHSQRRGLGRATLLAALALVATALPLAATEAAHANGNCTTYWASGTGGWSGAPAAGGTGTLNDPYLVGSQEDLDEVRYCLSGNFTQIADVALVGQWTPIPDFAGNYQGDGRTIDGLTITAAATNTLGLFETIAGGTVADLNLTNVDINSPLRSHVGALAGQSYSPASISGVSATGSVVGSGTVGGLIGYVEESEIANSNVDVDTTATGSFVGGLTGWLYASSITNSSASGNTTSGSGRAGGLAGVAEESATITNSSATGNVGGGSQVGGLVGAIWNASIATSSAAGTVSAQDQAGGLIGVAFQGTQSVANSFATGDVAATAGSSGGFIGQNGSTGLSVTNSYESGAVAATVQAGGLIGVATQDPASVTESFWNSTANPGLSDGPGTAKTQAQLRDIATFTNASWAIQQGSPATDGNVWGICVPSAVSINSGYPFLQWGRTSNACPTIPSNRPQTPTKGCVTPGPTNRAIPRRGTKQLMKPGCATNAGVRIGVRVRATALRGDVAYYRLQCRVSSKSVRAVSRNASGYYCLKGALEIRTFGYKLALRVVWGAQAVPGYRPYSSTKLYRT